MVPIRIGTIGLSPGSWAANAHLPYLQSSNSKFEIVAVCNSSVESAARAVKELSLPEGTRSYGNVQDIADDKDVDRVVCTTRVDRHYDCILPSLKAGKDVFVEWPLGSSLQEAKELVLSTTINSQGLIGGPKEIETQEYLLDRGSGASLLTIPVLHLLDSVQEALSEFSSFQSLLSNQRLVVKIIKADGSVVRENVKKTTPDHVMIQGTLKSGAVLSATIQGGAPFKGSPGLEWRIYGEKGEIRITGASCYIEIVGTNSFELHDFNSENVDQITLKEGSFADMDPINRNVARLYEAIAAGEKSVLCGFEEAVKRYEFIEEIYTQNPGV